MKALNICPKSRLLVNITGGACQLCARGHPQGADPPRVARTGGHRFHPEAPHVIVVKGEDLLVPLHPARALTDLSVRLRGLNERQFFRTLSYDLQHPTLERNKGATLFPRADPGKKYGTYCLGVINTVAMPTATKDVAPINDPKQCMTSLK